MVGSSPNRRVLGLACAWSAPMAAAQIIAAWVSLGFEDDVDQGHERSVLHHFFAPYTEGAPAECAPAARCLSVILLSFSVLTRADASPLFGALL